MSSKSLGGEYMLMAQQLLSSIARLLSCRALLMSLSVCDATAASREPSGRKSAKLSLVSASQTVENRYLVSQNADVHLGTDCVAVYIKPLLLRLHANKAE